MINENVSMRKAFSVMEAVGLYGAIICVLKGMHLQPRALGSCAANLSKCDVWYDAALQVLSFRCREAHGVLFLFLVFHLCLSSIRRIFTLLFGAQSWSEIGGSLVTSGRVLLFCTCERGALHMVVVRHRQLSLSKVAGVPRSHPLPVWSAARMQSVLFLSWYKQSCNLEL